MAIGDYESISGCRDLYYLDTGMYDVEQYGAVYVVDAERPAVVDTGIGTNREHLFSMLDELDIEPEFILPTHVHLDHAGGAGFLAERYPDATVMTHEIGVPHLVDPSRLIKGTKAAVDDQWQFYTEPKPIPEDRIESLAGGDTVDLGDRTLDVIHAPGHAPHQVIFHDDADDIIFTADAAGIWATKIGEIRPTSPPSNFNLEGCLEDVNTIMDRDPAYLGFGHFGPKEYTDGLMERYKRVLVEWVEAVRSKRAELGDDEAVIEHFVEHTEMDAAWGERKARNEAKMNVKGVLGYLDYVENDD